MFHKVTNPFSWPNQDYYDEISEVADLCKVHFPNNISKDMTEAEMLHLAENEEWYVIVNESNYGVCDHWVSKPFAWWIRERYPKMTQFVDKQQNTLGYCRKYQSVRLTKEANFFKAEVWNS